MRNRRGYFFIAFIAAAVTFGSLTAFVNPRYSGMSYGWHHRYNDRFYQYRNDAPPYAYPDSAYRNEYQNKHQ